MFPAWPLLLAIAGIVWAEFKLSRMKPGDFE